jgi:phosphopantetheinyl transferase (holo-ACP synthase)
MATKQDDGEGKLDATHGTDLLHEAINSIEQLDGDMVSLCISHENEFAVATALFI